MVFLDCKVEQAGAFIVTGFKSLIPDSFSRLLLLFTGIIGLIVVYMLQNISYLEWMGVVSLSAWPSFVVNKLIRFLLNDGFTLCIIFSLFQNRRYRMFAVFVQLVGLFLLFPIYMFVKYHWGDSYRNLDANLHRLIMNPILLMLLIPALYLQQQSTEHPKS